MKLFYISILLLFGSSASCQWKQIPLSSVYGTEIKLYKCLDSTGRITTSCLSAGAPLDVTFFQVFIEADRKTLRLIGRTVFARRSPGGFPGIGVFLTNAKDGYVRTTDMIYDTDDMKAKDPLEGGFFDITISLKDKESLFFYNNATRLIEFQIYKLLK